MKGFAFLLVAAVASVHAGSMSEEYRMLKKWAEMKSFESCFGKENMKKWMVSMKKSTAKCTGQDMPELDLPMFQSPYRVIQALLDNAERTEENKLASLMGNLQRPAQIVPIPIQVQPQNNQFEDMMKHFMMIKMMKKMHSGFHRHSDESKDMDMESDDTFSKYFQKRQWRMEDMMDGRYKRQAEESSTMKTDMLDLGDRLSDKLMEQKYAMQAKIGNVTCILRDQGMIDANDEISMDGIMKHMKEYQFEDEWFKNRLERDHQNCYDMAQAIPKSILDQSPFGPKLCKLKKFMHCCEMSKKKSCMHCDIKNKLEENFGPLSTLVSQTGLKEEELFPLVIKLLHGDMFEH